MFRSADDQNDVHILADVADVSKARTWLGSSEMKSVMDKGGVVGSPSIRSPPQPKSSLNKPCTGTVIVSRAVPEDGSPSLLSSSPTGHLNIGDSSPNANARSKVRPLHRQAGRTKGLSMPSPRVKFLALGDLGRRDLSVHKFECADCGDVETKILFREQAVAV